MWCAIHVALTRIVIHSSVYDKTVLLNALALTTNAMILRRGRGLYNIWTQSFSPFFTNIWDIYYWSYYLLHFVPVLLGYKFTFSIPKSGLLLNSKTPLNIIDAFLDIILYSYTFSANLAVYISSVSRFLLIMVFHITFSPFEIW